MLPCAAAALRRGRRHPILGVAATDGAGVHDMGEHVFTTCASRLRGLSFRAAMQYSRADPRAAPAIGDASVADAVRGME